MKPTIKYLFLLSLLLGISSISFGQNLDDIIDKHLKAHGDLKKWEDIKSMKITGLFTAFSVEDEFFAIKTKCGSYYSELALGQFDVIESFNGETGWTIDPWQEFTFPRELNKDERTVFKQKAEFFSPFFKYKEEGSMAEFVGDTTLDGVEVYEIKLTRSDGYTETWFLDTKTYLEYKCVSTWVDFAYGTPADTYFDDFRDFDGLIIPCYVERTFWQRDRVLIIENVEFNIDLDPTIFSMPKSAEIRDLDFLIGDWGVAVNTWIQRANRWYPVDSTDSNIEYKSTNMIQENISISNVFVQSKITNFTYDSEKSTYIINTYNGHSSNFSLFEGTKNDSSFVLKSTTVGCDTTAAFIVRITYSNISDMGFDVEYARSFDNEETWMPIYDMKYFRKD